MASGNGRRIFAFILGLILLFCVVSVFSAETPGDVDPVIYIPVIKRDRPYLSWVETIGGSKGGGFGAVAETMGGNFLLAGWAENEQTGWLGLLSPAGELSWQNLYSGTAFVDMKAVGEDGFIAVTSREEEDGWRRVGALVRLGPDGAVRWVRYLEDETFLTPYAVAILPGGGFVVQGHRWYHPFVWGFDVHGNVAWQRSTGFVAAYRGLKVTADGAIFVYGNTFDEDPFIMKLNADGTIAWQKEYAWDSPLGSPINDIVSTTDGGYVVAGEVGILKLAGSGDPAWVRSYSWIYNVIGFSSMVEIEGGHLIVAGGYYDSSYEGAVGAIMELEADGDVVWSNSYGVLGSRSELFLLIESRKGGYVATGSLGEDGSWILRLDETGSAGPDCDLIKPIEVSVSAQQEIVIDSSAWEMAMTDYPTYLGTPTVSPANLVVARLCPAPANGASGIDGCEG